MSYQPKNPNGQTTSANSTPVVIASDQSAIPITVASIPSHAVTNVGTFAVQVTSSPTTAVTGPITDTQIRATPLPVSGTVAVTGVATETTLAALNTKVPSNLTTKLASTAAVATDPALVVAISPNNTVPVSLASVPSHAVTLTSTTITGTVAVTDNASSLTVDAPVGAPAFVRLSDGAAAITTLPVSLASVPSHAVTLASTTITGSVGVTGPLTDTQLRATAVPVSGTVTANTGLTQPLTDTQLRLTAVPVSLASVPSHAVTLASTTITGSVAVTGPLTDTQLRATALPVSGTVTANLGTIAGLALDATMTGGTQKAIARGGAKGVTVAADVTSTVIDVNTQALDVAVKGTVPVSGAFYQATQPVSAVSLPLPTGAATETTTAAINTKLPASLTVKAASTAAIATDPALVVAISPNNTVPVSLASVPSHAVTLASTTITGSVATTGTYWQATQPVSLVSVPTHGVTGTFWQATQPVSGTVTVAGVATETSLAKLTLAQSAALGTNTGAMVMGSVTTAAPTYTTGNINPLSLTTTGDVRVSLASVPSHDVTNAGTFAVQAAATLAAETTKVIGTVNIAAAQTLATVTTVGTVTNLSQLGGVAINMNTGVRATGTQRVTIATDDVVQIKNTPDATATYSPTNATTTAYAASLIAKASAGNLYAITGYNANTTAQFIQVHNSATLPANGAVPVLIFKVPASGNFSFDLASWGRYFSAGITLCNSSTGPTKTIGAADCWFDVQYK